MTFDSKSTQKAGKKSKRGPAKKTGTLYKREDGAAAFPKNQKL